MGFEDRILAATTKLPRDIAIKVLMDVNLRITDWRASGGNDDDAYIEQQVRYAENVAKAYETKRLIAGKQDQSKIKSIKEIIP